MLKGTTTIELTDVKSGQVRKITHENMVTNCVNDLLKNAGLHKAPATFHGYTLGEAIGENLFGGIFLWKNPLNTDASDYIIPADNECVGYGCELGNNTINDKMGSYNDSESGAMENGYRHVWDFTTNQGNGEISAVSLMPRITGQLGLGLAYDKSNSSLFVPSWKSFCELRHSYDVKCLATRYNPCLYIKDDYIYGVKVTNLSYVTANANEHISRNGKKLILQKTRFSRSKVHLKDNVFKHNTIEEEIEIQLPDELNLSSTATAWYGFCNYDDGHIYLGLTNTNYSKNLVYQICKINIETFACEVIDINIPNAFPHYVYTAGEYWTSTPYNYNLCNRVGVYNNKFIFSGVPETSSNGHQSGYVDLSAPNIYQRFKNYDDSYVSFNRIYAKIGKYLYVGSGTVKLINLENDSVSYLNTTNDKLQGVTAYSSDLISSSYYADSWNIVKCVDNECESYLYAVYSDSDKTSELGHFIRNQLPHVMTTKNNLDTAVTKTAGQTMKVTYVITEV